jgi:SAM-dependent methyltransferase
MNDAPQDTPLMTPADAWSTYWEKGALHSCPSAFGANYDDGISAFWVSFFSALPANASILDVGTGNGGIAFLARDVGQQTGKNFRVTGIDAATIDPALAARHHGIALDGVTFHSHVPAEHTGYPDASVDAAVSQYAIEYSDTDASVAELGRILKPDARFALLVHHSGSAAASATRAELTAFSFMAEQAPLLSCATWLVEHLLGSGPDPDPMLLMQDPVAAEQVTHFGQLRERLIAYAGNHPQAGFVRDLALRISGILQQIPTTGGAIAQHSLQQLAREMAAHQSRLQAMADACHSQQDIDQLLTLLQQNGLHCERCDTLYRNQQDLMGWAIVGQRT